MEAVYVTGILSLVQTLLKILSDARAAAGQNKEWTPEEEAVFDAKLAEIKTSPIWQIAP